MGSSEILTAAMALSEKERASIALELLDSLHDDLESSTDSELLAEADRREAMMDDDPDSEISHDDLLAAFDHLRRK